MSSHTSAGAPALRTAHRGNVDLATRCRLPLPCRQPILTIIPAHLELFFILYSIDVVFGLTIGFHANCKPAFSPLQDKPWKSWALQVKCLSLVLLAYTIFTLPSCLSIPPERSVLQSSRVTGNLVVNFAL